jgi:hypothetical protein
MIATMIRNEDLCLIKIKSALSVEHFLRSAHPGFGHANKYLGKPDPARGVTTVNGIAGIMQAID